MSDLFWHVLFRREGGGHGFIGLFDDMDKAKQAVSDFAVKSRIECIGDWRRFHAPQPRFRLDTKDYHGEGFFEVSGYRLNIPEPRDWDAWGMERIE